MTSRHALVLAAVAAAALLLLLPAGASAQAPSCPNANPIVKENYCAGGATSELPADNPSENIGGFATKTSFNRGQNIPLKIAAQRPRPHEAGRHPGLPHGLLRDIGARLIPGAGANGVVGQQQLHLQPDGQRRPGARLRQLERHVHHPRRPRYPPPACTSRRSARRTRTSRTGSSSSSATTTASPESQALRRPPDRDLSGLQHLGRQVPLLRQERRRRTRSPARSARSRCPSTGRSTTLSATATATSGPTRMVQWLERQGYDVTYTDDVAGAPGPG